MFERRRAVAASVSSHVKSYQGGECVRSRHRHQNRSARYVDIAVVCGDGIDCACAHGRTQTRRADNRDHRRAADGARTRGYRLELLSDMLVGPRLLTFAPNGELLIGSKSGRVYRLTPPYTRPEVLVTLEDYPHSVALRGDEMLIAETNGLYRTFYRPGQARILPQDVKLLAPLPSGGTHSS